LPVRLILALCLGWAVLGLIHDTADAWDGWSRRGWNSVPCAWRLGMAPVERLRRCLAGVDGLVPAGTVVAFASQNSPCDGQFFRWRWAAYLLPQLEVTTLDDVDGQQLSAYLITYRLLPAPLPGTRLYLVRQLDGGRLYRINRP
jgi:hypothetical protein